MTPDYSYQDRWLKGFSQPARDVDEAQRLWSAGLIALGMSEDEIQLLHHDYMAGLDYYNAPAQVRFFLLEA
jgi:hypothetical protein